MEYVTRLTLSIVVSNDSEERLNVVNNIKSQLELDDYLYVVCIDEESTLIVLGMENFESIFCIGDD